MAGRHVLQVVSLPPLIAKLKLQRRRCSGSRNSISISYPQVACGAYHSLALVRSLPQQNTQNPSEKTQRGRSPHYSVTEREESFAADTGHYCPLGVELTEVMTDEVTILQEGKITETYIDSGLIPCCTQKDNTLLNVDAVKMFQVKCQ